MRYLLDALSRALIGGGLLYATGFEHNWMEAAKVGGLGGVISVASEVIIEPMLAGPTGAVGLEAGPIVEFATRTVLISGAVYAIGFEHDWMDAAKVGAILSGGSIVSEMVVEKPLRSFVCNAWPDAPFLGCDKPVSPAEPATAD